ncbi:MAG: DNA replication and repair protein RecF [Treponema sp.]|nr:DNA replication and repair protein RecF [Treponema sp.]
MFFNSLRTTAFRNLADKEIFTGVKDVFLVGENGQGKTNFLEAVYFCAYASSFRTVRDSELSRNSLIMQNNITDNDEYINEKDFSAEVKLSNSLNDSILVKVEKEKKLIYIDGKRAEDRRALLSITPSIVFCHEDMEFISGSPERRRWFFDQTLSLYDPVYLDDLRKYRRVLKTRNSILRDHIQGKQIDNFEQVLDVLDPQLAGYGQKLMEKRQAAVKEYSGIFGALYEEVSGISGLTIQYTQSWKEDNIISHLQKRRTADISAGLSLSGPHRDRYQFIKNSPNQKSNEFTGSASTGQRRLLALLLRSAQSRCYSAMTGQKPVLLLDDVLLEMDGEKRRRFLLALPDYDQAFYTFLPDEPYQRYQKDDTLIYTVKGGEVFQ